MNFWTFTCECPLQSKWDMYFYDRAYINSKNNSHNTNRLNGEKSNSSDEPRETLIKKMK